MIWKSLTISLQNPLTFSPLPVADKSALEFSRRLSEKIRLAIDNNLGLISFETYMQMALYEPGLGYYSAGTKKFGAHGDFVTAPEISPLFSSCIAKQCRQILSAIPSPACILELGPGSGAMAVDILKQLERDSSLPDTYYMLELSADLRQRQQQNINQQIPHIAPRIVWLQQLPQTSINGVILANEVFDSMPVRRISISKDNEIIEHAVSYRPYAGQQVEFQWVQRPLEPGLTARVQAILKTLPAGALPLPYIADLNFYIRPWLNSLNDILDKGLILISDYGYPRHEYFHPQRYKGSLLCHYRHRVHTEPFYRPGLQDITAMVDFTGIAEAAVDAGLRVAGFTTQAHFLLACGLQQLVPKQTLNNTKARINITRQINSLTMPEEMGEKFKFIGLSKSLDIPLTGFNFIDQTARL